MPKQEELVLSPNIWEDCELAAWKKIANAFEEANPGIAVRFELTDHDSYDAQLLTWLTEGGTDIVMMDTSYAMRELAKKALFVDLTELWDKNNLREKTLPTNDLLCINGTPYGVPFTTANLGVLYRKDIFEKNELTPPTTWSELITVCNRLRQANIAPIAVDTVSYWPTAFWFDYINIRTNGAHFHNTLVEGDVSLDDPALKTVFDHWKQLAAQNYFFEPENLKSWHDVQACFLEGKAAMFLTGSYITRGLVGSELDNIGFFRFPAITPEYSRDEALPLASAHISAMSSHKESAIKFMGFLSQPRTQQYLNGLINQLPARLEASSPDNDCLKACAEVVADRKSLARILLLEGETEQAIAITEKCQAFMREHMKN